jgi:ABC-type multidrug transport system fused ATPase/permease subunit
MKVFLRYLTDQRGFWPCWLPLLVLAVAQPVLGVAMPLVERQFIDDIVLSGHLDALPSTVLVYCLLWLAATASQAYGGAMGAYLTERVAVAVRERLLAHCERLSLTFSRREHSGRTMSLFVNDVPNVASLFGIAVLSPVTTVAALLVGTAAMFSLSWQLAVVGGIAPLLVSGLATIVTRPLRPASRRAQDKAAELTERLQENLTGLREIVAFGQGRLQQLGFTRIQLELLRLRMRVTLIDSAFFTGQSLFSLTLSLAILGYGGWLVIQHQTTIGTLVAMRSLLGMLYVPAGQLFSRVAGAQKALASADRIYAFLDETPRVVERPGAHAPERVAGAVTFEDVSFGYTPGRAVLRGVSLTARPGETIALVGPSGAGKSTLVSLIPRFYDPDEGRLLLDGVDLRELTLEGLRDEIGMVFQDGFLFATTLRENIAFGSEGATEAEIIEAARAANAWEFIEQLPDGLDTQVGERGVRLSEGQKQRLTIARALLRDPRILILDEPTSALDARSEHLLQSALDHLMRGRTTFVIAHRLATVRRADRILVLDNGRIEEQGTHDELLRQGGLYRELFDLQFGEQAQAPTGLVAEAPTLVG